MAVQVFFGLVAAASVIWFLDANWFPVINKAIHQLPGQGMCRRGRLEWYAATPMRLAEGRFLALAVDLRHEGLARTPSDLYLELGETDVQIFSLLGFVRFQYPVGWVVAVNQPDTGPWWGAWSAPLLVISGMAVVGMLMVMWSVLATIYFLPVSLAGFFMDRDLSLGGAWRLSGAALMVGALFLTASIVLYGLGVLDIVLLGIAVGCHILVGWFYLVAGLLAVPLHPAAAAARGNPFNSPKH